MARRNWFYLLTTSCLLFGLFTGRVVFFVMAYLFLALIAISFVWSWIALIGIHIQRITKSYRSQVGRDFVETFRVKNSSIFPKPPLEVRDFSDLPKHRSSHVTAVLNVQRTYEWRVETLCLVRGEFQLGPISVTALDPFGLFRLARQIGSTQRIVVYPSILPISAFTLPMGVLSGGEAQRTITQNVTTNAAGVRDYVSGDSINRIHWKSTARRNKLIVKEFELDPQVDIWLFVDFSSQSLVEAPTVQRQGTRGVIIPSSNSLALPASTEEYSAVIAASLTNYFIDQDRSIGFGAYIPHREVYIPERGHRQLTRILESLAVARSFTEHTLHEMLALEAHSFARGTTLVIITASLDMRWISELFLLRQRGIRPVCVLLDALTFGGITTSNITIEGIQIQLESLRIPTIVIRYGDDLSISLSQAVR